MTSNPGTIRFSWWRILKDHPLSLWHSLFLFAFAITLVVMSAMAFYQFRAEITAQKLTLQGAKQASVRAAQVIEAHLRAAMPVTEAIAADLDSGRLDVSDLYDRFAAVLRDHPLVYGVGAAFEPFAYAEAARLHAPFLVRQESGVPRRFQIERRTDYTAFVENWYREPLLNGAMWRERSFWDGRNGREILTQFAVPFFRPGEDSDSAAPIGIVFVAYALSDIETLVDSLETGHAGYQYVISGDGRYVIHPRRDLVRAGRSAFDVASKDNDIAMYSLAVRSVKGEPGHIDHADRLTGEEAWIVHEPVAASGWSVITVVPQRRVVGSDAQRHARINLLLMGLLSALFLTGFIIGFHQFDDTAIWFGAVGLTLFLLAGVGLIWFFVNNYPPEETGIGERIVNRTNLEHFLEKYERESADLNAERPIYVPTGVFIQSIEFATNNNVKVTGYIWQKYKRGVHRGISRGFVFPEAENPLIKEVYHRDLSHSVGVAGDDTEAATLLQSLGLGGTPSDELSDPCDVPTETGLRDCSELIGWYFFATLRQDFSYEKYPFDRQDVWLRLWHRDFDRNIVLVPDLGAYSVTDPATLPGVETDFVLSGWSLESAAFEFRRHVYNTNFGISRYVGQSNFPELYYSVRIKREFLGPFVVQFLPQLVVAAMLFMILLLGAKKGDKARWLGFATKDVLRACSVLIIVLIFAHAGLRDRLFSPTLVYPEYFYIALYLSCLLVSANSIAFAVGKIRWIEYHDNLIPKLLFLPVFASVIFVITLLSLY